jgi:hypothetical protein
MSTAYELGKSFREKKWQWVAVGILLLAMLASFIWLNNSGRLDPLPEEPSESPQASEQQAKPDDIAARTALGKDVVKALKRANVTAAIASIEIYREGEVTITLMQAKDDLGSEAQVSGIAQGVAAVIFTEASKADTVFVHDGDGKTIGLFSRNQ